MRILTTSLCYPTPAHPEQGIFVQRRAAALVEHAGLDLQVLAPQPWCPLLRRTQPVCNQAQPLPATYPKLVSVPVLGWATDGLAYAWAIRRFVSSVRQSGGAEFDLIDAHFEYPDGVGAWLAGRRLGIPVVVTIRGKIVSLSRRAIRRAQIAAMLRGVDARIAVSKSLAHWVHKVGGSDLSVNVIPNGVDTGTFFPAPHDEARIALGWDPHARYVLAVGHLQRLKGFDRLVAVMPAVRAALGDVRLILVGSRRGERSFQADLQRSIARVNRMANVSSGTPCARFIGPAASDALNLMYNAADLMVNASRSEGWNNAITEALATGTPVVATDVGGNREQILAHGQSQTEGKPGAASASGDLIGSPLGMIVPDGDAKALGHAIITALTGDWDRPCIAAHGATRRWEDVAREVHAVFQRVVRGPARSYDHDEPRTSARAALCAPRSATSEPGESAWGGAG